MFTGLVQVLGKINSIQREGAGCRLTISAPRWSDDLEIGESVAINGVCLTVVERSADLCTFQAGPETLARTNLGELVSGSPVNLERALRLCDRLGGHLVQGHVDGVGWVQERRPEGDWELFWFGCSAELTRQMVSKGSIAVDGVSLTLVDVTSEAFSVALIPHTLAHTTLGNKRAGARVNLETDILAKYVDKYLQKGGVSLKLLQEHGMSD